MLSWMHDEEPTKLYKVVIGEDVADEILEHAAMFYNLPYSLTFGRKSPIVYFCELTDREAIDIAEANNDITVTRAPEGWSI